MVSARDHVIKLKDGRGLGYAEYGDPKGKPVFFFHGWPVSRLSGAVTDEAAKRWGIRVISPDRPGYGLSDFKKDRSLLDWADDVLELADRLKIKKFAVVGISGGGPYAAVCAFKQSLPDKSGKIPKRLTKVGIVVGLAPTWIPGALDNVSWNAKLGWSNYGKSATARKLGALSQLLLARYSPGYGFNRFIWGGRADQKLFADPVLRKNLKENYEEAFRQGVRGPEYDLKLYTKDWGFDLAQIKTQVYLWYGGDDKNVSLNMGKYYKSQIKNSKLTVYPGEGHLISRTRIEEILKTLK